MAWGSVNSDRLILLHSTREAGSSPLYLSSSPRGQPPLLELSREERISVSRPFQNSGMKKS